MELGSFFVVVTYDSPEDSPKPMLNARSPVRALRWVTALALLCAPAVGLARSLVPAPLRAAIVVRSSGYERGFAERPGPAVLAVVAGKSGAAAEDGRAMHGVFTQLLKETRIGGRPTRVILITHETSSATIEELRNQRAEIVYFASGLEAVVAAVPAREGNVARILLCADGADVAQGCTLGVELSSERPRVVLNLKQANAAGLRFDPGLLRLARIVR